MLKYFMSLKDLSYLQMNTFSLFNKFAFVLESHKYLGWIFIVHKWMDIPQEKCTNEIWLCRPAGDLDTNSQLPVRPSFRALSERGWALYFHLNCAGELVKKKESAPSNSAKVSDNVKEVGCRNMIDERLKALGSSLIKWPVNITQSRTWRSVASLPPR